MTHLGHSTKPLPQKQSGCGASGATLPFIQFRHSRASKASAVGCRSSSHASENYLKEDGVRNVDLYALRISETLRCIEIDGYCGLESGMGYQGRTIGVGCVAVDAPIVLNGQSTD